MARTLKCDYTINDYTDELGELICHKVAEGEAIKNVLVELKINYYTFYRWLDRYPELERNYTRAREARTDRYEEYIEKLQSIELPTLNDGRVDTGLVQLMRVKADNAKWMLSKLNRNFSDKLQIDNNVSLNEGTKIIVEMINSKDEIKKLN